MATFDYSGRTTAGVPIRGRIEAATTSGVAAELVAKGIVPLQIVAAGTLLG